MTVGKKKRKVGCSNKSNVFSKKGNVFSKKSNVFSKKSNVFGQPFIFIFVLIVMVFVIVFGFRVVNNLKDTQEKVKYVEFKSELTNAVNVVYNGNEGTTLVFSRSSRSHKPLIVPRVIKEVCVNGDIVGFKPEEEFPDFRVEHLKGDGECIKVVSGVLSFTLENVADREVFVLISE